MGLPLLGIDGRIIRRIKNYIFKCYSCSKFVFDTSRMFCDDCGYNTLMKIGYSIDYEGKVKVFDKEAEARLRGKQVILLNFYQIYFWFCFLIKINLKKFDLE